MFGLRIQTATGVFIAVSVVFFAVDFLLAEQLILWGAKSSAIWGGEWYRLLAANFIHSGVMHLLFNMYALYTFGRIVEDLAGGLGFAAVYILGGVSGFLTSLLAKPESLSVGASAAVFALMGYTIHFRLRRLPLRWMPIDTAFLQILLLNLLMAFSVPHIDHFAHLGGFVGGFFAAGALGLPPSRFSVEQETPFAERLFAAAGLALFLWVGLAPLSFAEAVGVGSPRVKEAMVSRYERYFEPFVLADPAVLWLEPSGRGGSWTMVQDQIRRPADSPLAVAVFWRWARGGGPERPATYYVRWERQERGGGWVTVQVDRGVASRADPGAGRIFQRSLMARERADELQGEWRVTVEVDGKARFGKEFTIALTSLI